MIFVVQIPLVIGSCYTTWFGCSLWPGCYCWWSRGVITPSTSSFLTSSALDSSGSTTRSPPCLHSRFFFLALDIFTRQAPPRALVWATYLIWKNHLLLPGFLSSSAVSNEKCARTAQMVYVDDPWHNSPLNEQSGFPFLISIYVSPTASNFEASSVQKILASINKGF